MKYVQEERKGKSFGEEIHPRGLEGEGGKDRQKSRRRKEECGRVTE